MVTRAAASLAVLAILGSTVDSGAQTVAPAPAADPQAEVAAHRAELDAVTADITVSQAREDELRKEVDAIDRDRASLNQALIDAAAQAQRLEVNLGQTEGRLADLLAQEDRIRASLADRREVLADVLAALQRMGDHPPPALLVRPEDALSALRSAILLGAVVPNVQGVAAQLATDLGKLVDLRTGEQQERDQLRARATTLQEQHDRIALLLDSKRAEREQDAAALSGEQAHATALADQASTLRDLISGLESAKPQPATPPPAVAGAPAARSLGSAGRLSPSVAFVDAKGLLPKPAAGRVVSAFGDSNSVGVKAQGVSLATRAGAEIVSPTDGTVAYAGPFRSYGQLLIINAGGGYHVILAGMERIDVQLGQFVLAGEPVAAMASQQLASAGATLVGTTEPVLYVEFRKDGAAIDPAPWWATSN